MKNLLFILLTTLILGGCVSHPLTPENRAQIKTAGITQISAQYLVKELK